MNHDGYLTIAELCDLIRECHASDVKHIRFGTLDISFGMKPQWGTAPLRETSPPVAAISGLTPGQPGEYVNEESLLKDELALKEDQLAEMMITDPLEYERLLTEGELVNEDTESAGSP